MGNTPDEEDGEKEETKSSSKGIGDPSNPEIGASPGTPKVEPEENDRNYSDKEIRNVALAVIAGVLFGGIATGVAFPTLPLLGEILGISAVMLGIILSANRIARLAMNTPAGQFIDKTGARKPMILGLFIQGFAPFGYVIGLHTPTGTLAKVPIIGEVSYPSVVFVLARCFWGFGSAFVIIGGFVIITKVTTQSNRGRWIGYMRGIQSLGFPSGLVMGGIISDLFDAQTAFITAGGLAMLAAFIAYFVIPDIKSVHESSTRLRDIPDIIRDEPRVLPIGIGNFTIRFLFGGVILTTVVMYASAYQIEFNILDAAGIGGGVLGVGILTSGGTTFITGRLSDELDNRILMTVPGFSVLAAGFISLAYNPTLLGILGSVIMMGVGIGAVGPALMAFLGDISPEDSLGKLGGVYNVMGDVGLALGPLIAAPAVADWFGYWATYIGCATLTVACLFIVNIPLVRN